MYMLLPKIIEGKNIQLIQMSDAFIEASARGKRMVADDFQVHEDWWLETRLAKLRYQQMRANPQAASWLLRAIVRKDDGQMLGHFNCHDMVNSSHTQKYHKNAVEFGYTIYKEFRRQGFAREAVRTMMAHLHQRKLIEAVILSASIVNEPSLAMIRSLNFQEVDTVRDGNDMEKVFLFKYR
jgi:[ribosomal protein S5]-alanine N-acetyltransferase